MEWITWLAQPENLALLATLWAALIAVAQVVVRFTPNDGDDKFVGRVALFKFGRAANVVRNLATLKKPKGGTDDAF